jgi:tRNA(Ile2) C34 agmatinyltransferase TiaS
MSNDIECPLCGGTLRLTGAGWWCKDCEVEFE